MTIRQLRRRPGTERRHRKPFATVPLVIPEPGPRQLVWLVGPRAGTITSHPAGDDPVTTANDQPLVESSALR